MLQQHESLVVTFARPEILGNVQDPALVEKNLRILDRDIAVVKPKLDDLKDRATTLGKVPVDQINIEDFTSLIFDYECWMDEHQSLLMPTASYLIEEISKAENINYTKVQQAKADAGINGEITAEHQASLTAEVTGEGTQKPEEVQE